MKISVIIPAYNEQNYIGKCLESVLKNSVGYDVEVIVVDNASTDNTAAIVKKYSGVKLLSEPSKGTNTARQTGYLESSGDLIANLDADNIVSKEWFAKIIEEFSVNPKLVALSGPYTFYDLNQWQGIFAKLYFWVAYPVLVLGNRFGGRGSAVMGGNVVMRRSALQAVGGYDTSFKFYGDDSSTSIRLKKAGEVKFDYRFMVSSSARRLKSEGMIKAASKYILNHIWVALFKKPYHQ